MGGSVFYPENNQIQVVKKEENSEEVENLSKEINTTQEAALLETQLSSLVWICTTTHNASTVTVIDANNPAEVLESFDVPTHLLCIASIPGASLSDYENNYEDNDVNFVKNDNCTENTEQTNPGNENNLNNIIVSIFSKSILRFSTRFAQETF